MDDEDAIIAHIVVIPGKCNRSDSYSNNEQFRYIYSDIPTSLNPRVNPVLLPLYSVQWWPKLPLLLIKKIGLLSSRACALSHPAVEPVYPSKHNMLFSAMGQYVEKPRVYHGEWSP